MSISGVARVKGLKENIILHWSRAASDHAEGIEQVLLHDSPFARTQVYGPLHLCWPQG